MILFRCFPWDRDVAEDARGGPVWFARMLQGDGRHDNPLVYGCLYVSESRVAAVVEQLARFAGRPVTPAVLRRFGLPLALAELELPEKAPLVDLDDPAVLDREGLRPSQVATHERARTQADAAALHERHPDAAGLRWWSTYESAWSNVTVFDRGAPLLRVVSVDEVGLEHEAVEEAATFLGLSLET